MRHFQLLLFAVAPLPFGVFAGSTEGSLVAGASSAHRLPASQFRALPGAVEVPAVALCADAYLHPAAAAVIEPVRRRRFQRPQDLLPDGTGQRRGGEA